ncbi:MAG: hydrogenase maturation protease [Deltaproteobacteria bacterium]|nr:hydrogenase maturation protease [Deltaproteobacteria bacterium]
MKCLIVGVGSTIRTDDGVGVHAVRRLQGHIQSEDVDTIELGTGGLSLLDHLDGYDRVIIIDAIMTGRQPGTICELTAEEATCSVHLGVGHEADLKATLAVGLKVLRKQMPRDIIVLGVEVQDITTFSEDLTPAVNAALPRVLKRIKAIA